MSTPRSALVATALIANVIQTRAADTPEGLTWLPSDPLDLTLAGSHSFDLWLNLSSVTNMSRTAPFIFNGTNFGNQPYSINGLTAGGMFPGTTMWAPYKSQFWTGATQGELVKIANGSGGGPYPAGSSIYYGGASPEGNVNGGTLGLKGYAAAGVKTVSAQISLGEAYGYALHDTGPAGIGVEDLPKLKVYDSGGGLLTTLDATFSGVIKKAYNGSLEMPPGSGLDEDIYINTYGLQWNLADIEGAIASFQLDWTGVQHAQLWSLRIDQTDALQPGFVFDLTSQWTGAANSTWSDGGNWQNSSVPTTVGRAVFGTGSAVDLTAPATVGQMVLRPDQDFTVSSANDSKLSVGLNLVTESNGGPASHVVSADLEFPATTTVDVGSDTALSFTGDINGQGFYKRGPGPLLLAGSNTFTGTLILAGGTTTATGSSLTSAASLLDIKNARLVLPGSDRFEAEFKAKLSGTSIIGQSAWIQLGDANSGAVTQTFAELNAAKPQYVKGLNPNPQLDSPVHVVGGNGQISTLKLKGGTYSGYLGGAGENENQLSLVVEGPVVLQGTSSYAGDTMVATGGTLQLNREAALSSASHLTLNGGTLALGGFTYMTPGGADDNGIPVPESVSTFTRALGSGAGQVSLASGTLRAVGATRTVNFGGSGAPVSWGMPGFITEGSPLVMSSDAVANRIVLANAIDTGASSRAIQVNDFNSTAELSGVISGSGGITKSGQGSLILNGANEFTGPLRIEKGKIKLDSIGNAGGPGGLGNTSNAASSLVLSGADSSTYGGGELNYTGSANVSTDRLFTISGYAGSIANDGTGTIHFTNTGAVVFDHNGPSVLELRGTNNLPSRFDPLIADNGDYPVTLRKAGTGSQGGTGGYWIIGNENNSYTGQTLIYAGTLEVSKLANAGEPSSIGASPSAAANLILWRGTLRYTGPEVSTDRLFAFTLGTTAATAIDKHCRVDSSGTGALHFTNTGDLMMGDVNGTVQDIGGGGWLGFGGTFSGVNTFSPRIGGGITTNARLSKDGPGTWTLLNDANSWVGITEINGGTLAVNSIANGGIAIVMNTTVNSTAATVTNATGLSVGLPLHGPAMAPGTTIAAINGTAITLSQPATFTYSSGSSRNKVAGYPSGLGSAPNAPANLVINGGGLRYLGAGHVTDRRFTVGTGGATLDASGTGALNLNNSAALTHAGTTERVLGFTGTNPADNTFAAAIGDAGTGKVSVTKSGTGKWVLSGTNSYTGNTTVSGGTLKLVSPTLADASTVSVSAGAVLELGWTSGAEDVVEKLILDGQEAGPGVWGAEGSGASRTSPLLAGTGFIIVPGPFEDWAAQISDPAQRGRNVDPDGDGFSNLTEFLFGTPPATSNGSLVEAVRNGENLVLRWNELVAGGVYQLQETTDLSAAPWPASSITPQLAADQGSVPEGYVRKEAIVPVEGNARFLRVNGTEN